MMPNEVVIPIVNAITAILPGIIAMIRENHAANNPGLPALTDAEVLAALQAAVASSLAKDEAWLASHPPDIGDDVPGGGAA